MTIIQLAMLLLTMMVESSVSTHCNRLRPVPTKPTAFINFDDICFDGCCFNGEPQVYVFGHAHQVEGVHNKAVKFSQVGDFNVSADCVRAQNLPDECPYNVAKCDEGLTISFWVRLEADDNGLILGNCGNLFYFGGSMVTITPFGGATVLNTVLNEKVSFCFLPEDIVNSLAGSWTHFVYTLEQGGNGEVPRLFINGTNFNDTRCARGSSPTPFTPQLTLGCRPTVRQNISGEPETECGLNGQLDDFRLYSGVLSTRNIQLLGKTNVNLPPSKRGPCHQYS